MSEEELFFGCLGWPHVPDGPVCLSIPNADIVMCAPLCLLPPPLSPSPVKLSLAPASAIGRHSTVAYTCFPSCGQLNINGARVRVPLLVLHLSSLLYIIASVVTTILSDEKVNKQNGDSNVEQDHHDDQDGS